MAVDNSDKIKEYGLRARLPLLFRIGAVVAIAAVILTVIAGFYRERSKSPFKLKSEHASLSTDVTAEITNYERLESENGISKYYVKADYAKTFSDNHQELRNLYLEVYGEDGHLSDKLTAETALYIPEENKNFTAYLNGSVHIQTRDELAVNTNNLVYTRRTQVADLDEALEFEWKAIKGRAIGASLRMEDRHLDLLKSVEIEAFDSPELVRANVRYAKMNAGSASFDRNTNRIELTSGVNIALTSKGKSGGSQNTEVSAARSVAVLAPEAGAAGEGGPSSILRTQSAQVRTLEFFDNVRIVSADAGKVPTNIDSGYALYDRSADRFELKNDSHIVTAAGDKATDIRSSEAIYERSSAQVTLTGGVEITQGADLLKGDSIVGNLSSTNNLKDAVVRGNAFAKQTTHQRTSSISAPELNASFDDQQTMKVANAIGASSAAIVPDNDPAYVRIDVTSTRGIGMNFKGAGLLDGVKTDGRTTLQLTAPNGKPDAANKRVTADSVKTLFAANGKDLMKAEAVGNAELYVEPLNADPKNYRTTITAPRFDCDFYPGNDARTCVAGKKARLERVPTVNQSSNGNQVVTADQLTARFGEASHDVEELQALDNAKYSEQDRNAVGKQMTFTQSDGMVRIRGGEPTVWDSRARAKAREIDLDSRTKRSYLRGDVSATYYSAKQMKSAGPFGSSDKPVFVTSETAEFDQNAETAVFTQNARGWQESNFVRGDKLVIDQRLGRLESTGNVQSAVYNARVRSRQQQGAAVPVYASAGRLVYERDRRLIQYRDLVDIRQGTDRIIAGSADVQLDENNELSSTVAETNVVITQPGRRAAGDWVQYTAQNDTAILRGNPASVSDAENGASQAGQLTINMHENRVVSEGKTKQNPSGRIRSVYKVKPQ